MNPTDLVEFTLFVLVAAVIVLFSENLLKLVKKLFEIPLMLLTVPLLVASLLVTLFNSWIVWGMRVVHDFLIMLMTFLSQYIEKVPISFVMIVMLTAITMMPVILISQWYLRRWDAVFPYPYVTATILWFIIATIFVVWI